MKKRSFSLIIVSVLLISIFIYLNSKNNYLPSDDIIGVYVNSELNEEIPSKGRAMFQKAICDDANTKVTWDNDNWGLLISNLNKKIKCNLYFYSGQTVFDFDYTGGEQTFIAPVSGTYKLETWGAQGDGWWDGLGGDGGYSVGIIKLIDGKKLYIGVGGQGINNAYNGDGSGGGATSISKIAGELSSLINYKSDILIVSGGGGSGEREHGGSGGGYIGGTGYPITNIYPFYGTGGSQTTGGSGFEVSGNSPSNNIDGKFGISGKGYSDTDGGADGGTGYYGGGGTTYAGGGGGGSGYIGNSLLTNKVMYCYNCEESYEESTKTISTTCSEETPTSYCAKKGNGYARITLVSIDE